MGLTSAKLCSDCPPEGYPTEKTRCLSCPRRKDQPEMIEKEDEIKSNLEIIELLNSYSSDAEEAGMDWFSLGIEEAKLIVRALTAPSPGEST